MPHQAIDQISLPVLVHQHKNDAGCITLARGTEWILHGLKNAPIQKRWIDEGGSNRGGNPHSAPGHPLDAGQSSRSCCIGGGGA